MRCQLNITLRQNNSILAAVQARREAVRLRAERSEMVSASEQSRSHSTHLSATAKTVVRRVEAERDEALAEIRRLRALQHLNLLEEEDDA